MVEETPQAQHALGELPALVRAHPAGLTLRAGDLLIVGSRRAVRARSRFVARFEATDRRLRQSAVDRDLPGSVTDRATHSRIIRTDFASYLPSPI